MKVSLISYTPSAMDVLIFTKQTRLELTPGLMNEIALWPIERKQDELEYMARSIPSSWEFVDYVFLIEGVSRAYTHQAVRSRVASFAQQTMRILKVGTKHQPFKYITGPTVQRGDAARIYAETMGVIQRNYEAMIESGASIEDARGVLPTNISTNIVAKFNLRSLSELVIKRGNLRTQSEYRDVLNAMAEAVYAVHPWAQLFMEPRKHTVVERLLAIAARIRGTSLDDSNALIKEAEILQKELAQ